MGAKPGEVTPTITGTLPARLTSCFTSAAESHRARCVGVVLTGANSDGAAGLARIVELGGAAIVQDPEWSERSEMPRAALNAVPSARVAPLEEIASLLVELCETSKVRT